MKIVFDIAAGRSVGVGHLKRCLSIAHELVRLSFKVEFLTKDIDSSCLKLLSGIATRKTMNDNKGCKAIIVDKYHLTEAIVESYKKHCQFFVRIDDASPEIMRDMVSDIIINGNPYANAELYRGYISQDCYLIAGQDFVPMDERFCEIRKNYHIRDSIRTITITFGASKAALNYQYIIAKKIIALIPSAKINILNGKKLRGKFASKEERVKLLPFIDNVGKIFAESDLVICSASSTCWQLATIGVPFIAFQTADNQKRAFEYIEKSKIGIPFDINKIENGKLGRTITNLSLQKRRIMYNNSRETISCCGSRRIAAQLMQHINFK